MIIDGHSHGFHGKYLNKLVDLGGLWVKQFIDSEIKIAQDRPQYLDVDLRVEWIKKFNIDYQVITPACTLDVNLFPGESSIRTALVKEINDNMARLMEDSKGKLITMGTVSLVDFERSSKEMERAINGLGLKGISLYSHVNGIPLDAPEYESFWAKVNEMDVVVYIHPKNALTHPGNNYFYDYGLDSLFCWPFESTIALSRLVFSGLMKRYNNLKIVGHHLGGAMIPFLWGRIMETYEMRNRKMGNMINENLADYFSRFYYDTAVGGSASAVRCAYEVLGADKLIFATDAPHGPKHGDSRLETYPGVIKSLGLSELENEKILAGNVRKLLKLS
jgi:predicted TIM-barrel fold metal-dependent hydrolase